MVLGYSAPYYLRLRIYARQVSYFYRKLRKLPPVYDSCPYRCLAPEADRPNGCPDCDYQVFYRSLKANYEKVLLKELIRFYEEAGLSKADARSLADEDKKETSWTFENIEDDYTALCDLEAIAGTETADTPGKINPQWNVRVRLGIGIIREERYNVRREQAYEDNEKEKADARARAVTRKRGNV